MDKAKDGAIELFFVDASHFVTGGFVGIIWSKIRRFVRTSSGRARYNVLGTLNFATKRVETITNDSYITSIQVMELLDKLVINYPCKIIKVILDNASYQRCKAVKNYAQGLNIELIFLPTYSPNLNLIERFWKYVKSEVLNAAYHSTFQEFKDVIDNCIWQADKANISKMNSLITDKVQLFDHILSHNNSTAQSDAQPCEKHFLPFAA